MSLTYRADIDGLRAVAVLAVVLFHAFPDWIGGGFIGVDIFFVISGFLISLIIFEKLETGTFNFLEFYSRRVRRLFPALILVLVASLAFGWFALVPEELSWVGKHVAAGASFISNFVLLSESGYFDAWASVKPLLHLWSLAIEEQFYIIWPLTLWCAWKFRINFLAVSSLALLISYIFSLNGTEQDPIKTFYSPQTRFWELLAGSSLAWLILCAQRNVHSPPLSNSKFFPILEGCKAAISARSTIPNVASLLGSFLLVFGFIFISSEMSFPGNWALVPVIGTLLIIISGPNAWVNRTILSNKIAVWIGLISYPLYLWHWPLLAFARLVESEPPSQVNGDPLESFTKAWLIAISVALAWLTYVFIERPIRKANSGAFKVIGLLCLLALAGYAGYITYIRDGQGKKIWSDPFPITSSVDCNTRIKELGDFTFDGGCRLSKNMDPTVLLIGDSHAYSYRNAVEDNFHDETVLTIVETSCLPFSNNSLSDDRCRQKRDAIISYLEDNQSIKKVILVGYWSYLISGRFQETGAHWRISSPPEAEDIISFNLNARTLISRLLLMDKELILFKDYPDLDFNVRRCVNYRPLRLTYENTILDCWLDEESFYKRMTPFDGALDQTIKDFPQVKVFDPRKYICNNGKCYATDGSKSYYFDGDHLSYTGSEKIIREFLNELSN